MKAFLIGLVTVSMIHCIQAKGQYSAEELDGQVPTYLVSLETRGDSFSPWKHVCSGAIISPHHVVTAGGCFFNRTLCQSRIIHNKAIHHLDALYIHPRFSGFIQRSHDVAVAKVKTPFVVDKAKLPMAEPTKLHSVRRTGWQDQYSKHKTLLDQFEKITKCPYSVEQTLICSNQASRECEDDLGSPIVTKSQPLRLVGVLSRGRACEFRDNDAADKKGSEKDEYPQSVQYTKISSVLDFIKDALQGKLHVFGLY